EGLEKLSPEQLARIGRIREKRMSNREWAHPHDRDARIEMMKDERTHPAHNAEHPVELDTGALVAVNLRPADAGDTSTLANTVREARQRLQTVRGGTRDPGGKAGNELVTDKGYHSDQVLQDTHDQGERTYIAEPERGRRKWKGKKQE